MLRVMAYKLIGEIAAALRDIPSGQMVPAEEAHALITSMAGKYGIDLDTLFPWEKLEGIVYPYGDPSGWGLLLSSMLGVFSGDVWLAVTDEQHYPWPVVKLPAGEVQHLLLELPYFEYFVFDDAMERVVFDTHHNSLILCER